MGVALSCCPARPYGAREHLLTILLASDARRMVFWPMQTLINSRTGRT